MLLVPSILCVCLKQHEVGTATLGGKDSTANAPQRDSYRAALQSPPLFSDIAASGPILILFLFLFLGMAERVQQ